MTYESGCIHTADDRRVLTKHTVGAHIVSSKKSQITVFVSNLYHFISGKPCRAELISSQFLHVLHVDIRKLKQCLQMPVSITMNVKAVVFY